MSNVSRKALELLQEWLEEKKAYLQLLIERKSDRKKWSESGNPDQVAYYKPLYSQSILEVSDMEYEIADVKRAIIRLSGESEGDADPYEYESELAIIRGENERLRAALETAKEALLAVTSEGKADREKQQAWSECVEKEARQYLRERNELQAENERLRSAMQTCSMAIQKNLGAFHYKDEQSLLRAYNEATAALNGLPDECPYCSPDGTINFPDGPICPHCKGTHEVQAAAPKGSTSETAVQHKIEPHCSCFRCSD